MELYISYTKVVDAGGSVGGARIPRGTEGGRTTELTHVHVTSIIAQLK